MLRKLYKKLYRYVFEINNIDKLYKFKNIIISFSGGLGAQIFSASIYSFLENNNFNVYGDFKYFATNDQIKNKTKGISYWNWQLSDYNIKISNFKQKNFSFLYLIFNSYKFINDGDFKLYLAIKSMQNQYSTIFKIDLNRIQNNIDYKLYQFLNNSYIALHMRRGDYLNVASLVIPDKDYIDLLLSMNLVNINLIILSDSEVESETHALLKQKYKNILIYDNNKLSPFISHVIMTNATYLICSNSQFSFSAGLLSNGFVYYPTKWNKEDNDYFTKTISQTSHFHIKLN